MLGIVIFFPLDPEEEVAEIESMDEEMKIQEELQRLKDQNDKQKRKERRKERSEGGEKEPKFKTGVAPLGASRAKKIEVQYEAQWLTT